MVCDGMVLFLLFSKQVWIMAFEPFSLTKPKTSVSFNRLEWEYFKKMAIHSLAYYLWDAIALQGNGRSLRPSILRHMRHI